MQNAHIEPVLIYDAYVLDITALRYILQMDGTRSPQVHQFDRFGPPFKSSWLYNKINKHWADSVGGAQ